MTNASFFSKDSSPVAGLICLFGIFLYIVISAPLLDAIGVHYSGDQGAFYEKIHPGTYFILLSLVVLLVRRGNPLAEMMVVYRQQRIPALLLMLYIMLFAYMAARDKGAGLAFMIDTHLTMISAAIVLCYTPYSYCRRAIHCFIALAVLNSVIAIAESLGRFRIFTYDPEWNVLQDHYFRSSALRGHPLANAVFTAGALFVALALRYPVWLKMALTALFMTALVAFGGRAALGFSVLGITVYGLGALVRIYADKNKTLRQMLSLVAITLLAPLCMAGGLYLTIHSSLGERILATAEWDDSANSRELAWQALDYMDGDELFFGVSNERIENITYRMSLHVSVQYLENPWLLMFMHLGAVGFFLWLMGTLIFIGWLMKGKSFALKLTALAYFSIASAFNSFATKDPAYLIMVASVLCASRALALRPEDV